MVDDIVGRTRRSWTATLVVITLVSGCATTTAGQLAQTQTLPEPSPAAVAPPPPQRSGWKVGLGSSLLIIAAAGLAYQTYGAIMDGKCADPAPAGGVCRNVYDTQTLDSLLLVGSGLTAALGLFFVIWSKSSSNGPQARLHLAPPNDPQGRHGLTLVWRY